MHSISNSFVSNFTNRLPLEKLTQKPIVYAVAAVALAALACLAYFLIKCYTSNSSKTSINAAPTPPTLSAPKIPNPTDQTSNSTKTPTSPDPVNQTPPQPIAQLNDTPTPPQPVSDPAETEQTPEQTPDHAIQKPEISPSNNLPTPSVVKPKNVTLEEAQHALEQGIEISTEVKNRLNELMPQILVCNKQEDYLSFISKGQFFITFSIPEAPDVVFKVARHDKYNLVRERFNKTVMGKQVIMQYDLNRLHIPSTILLKMDEYDIIAEQRLSFKNGHFTQEDLYYKNADALEPVVKQLVRFIKETGDDDVRFNNYPILDQKEAEGELSIGVIDLEWAGNNPVRGIIGGEHQSPGLIGMMTNEKLVDILLEQCEQLGINLASTGGLYSMPASHYKALQLGEIKIYHNYQAYHQAKGITTGHEPIMSVDDIDQLGLELDEEGTYQDYIIDPATNTLDTCTKPCTLRDAVIDVINHLNKQLEKRTGHVKAIRSISLPIANPPFSHYSDLGQPPGKSLTFAEEQRLWLNRILNALSKKGYILRYDRRGGHGYSIKC